MRLALALLAVLLAPDDAARDRARSGDGRREPVPGATRSVGSSIRGRVQLDGPLPRDLVVEATVHLRGGARERLWTGVEPDGSFALDLPEGAVWGMLRVEYPVLQLAGGVVFEPGWTSICLRLDALAVVQGRVHASARASSAPDGQRWIACGPVGLRRSTDLPPIAEIVEGVLLEDGSFRIERVPVGIPLNLEARVGNAEAHGVLAPLAPREVRAMDLSLKAPGALRGVVEDEHGEPVEGAMLRLFPPDQVSGRQAFTDASGRFELEALASGRWRVEARKLGFDLLRPELGLRLGLDLSRQEVDVAEGEATELRFTLGLPAIVRGEVRLPDGSPCTRAQVSEADYDRRCFPLLYSNEFDRPRWDVDDSGRFAFAVHTGRVQVVAGSGGWAPSAPFTLDLEPGATREGIVLVVREPARLRGRVLDPRGFPAPPTIVALCYPDGTRYEFGSSFEGFDVPAGRARLETVSWPDVWSASAEVELVPYRDTEVELRLRYR